MKKKAYQKPTMDVMKIQQCQMICVSKFTTSGLGEDLDYSGGSGDMGGAF